MARGIGGIVWLGNYITKLNGLDTPCELTSVQTYILELPFGKAPRQHCCGQHAVPGRLMQLRGVLLPYVIAAATATFDLLHKCHDQLECQPLVTHCLLVDIS